MSIANRIKIAVLKTAGIMLLCFGVLLLIVGIGMTIDSGAPQSKEGPPIALSSLVFFVPSAILLLQARRIGRAQELTIALAELIRSYRRISLAELSNKLSTPLPLLMKTLSRALSEGSISGTFDRTTDEFIAGGTGNANTASGACPSCGSPPDGLYLPGDTIRCTSCGTVYSA
ncbi:MAG: hypothetical protein JXA20_18465 [Spirochaetes bacterium]|nr:hypothetical protein [Spirochaetota bacterium]